MMSFDEATHWRRASAGLWQGEVDEDWLQGRGVFGGILSAAAVNAAIETVGNESALRSVNTRYLEAVVPGPVALHLQILRAGRSVTTIAVQFEQDGRVGATAEITFGAPRTSAIVVAPPGMPPGPEPNEQAVLPYVEGLTPRFTKQMAFIWGDGPLPYTGASQATIGGWCKYRTEASGFGALVGHLDAWPSPVLPLSTGPFPASTVHWTAHLTGRLPSSEWVRFQSHAVTAEDGYTTSRGELWDQQGVFLGWMEQLVAVFDQR